MGMTIIWILGWTGISVVAGSFFDLPLKTVGLIGATLGPLGFMVVVAIGVLESRGQSEVVMQSAGAAWVDSNSSFDDPFS